MSRKLELSRAILNKVDGELDAAIETLGMALGSDNTEYVGKVLRGVYELLESAQFKINSYLSINDLPTMVEERNKKARVAVISPTEIEGSFSVVETKELGHSKDCAKIVFATHCNCGLEGTRQTFGLSGPSKNEVLTSTKSNGIVASAKKLLNYLGDKSVEQEDTIVSGIPIEERF